MNNLTKESFSAPCQQLGLLFVVFGVVFISITLFLSLLFNGFILLSFKLNPTLRTLPYAFIINLAITNIISTVLLIPMEITYLTSYPSFPFPATVNNLWNAAYLTLLAGSVLNFTAVSVDRYIRIRYPLHYMQYLNKQNVIQLLVFLWIYVVLLGILMYFAFETPTNGVHSFQISSSYFIPFLVGNVFVPFCLIIALYSCIFRITRRHMRCIDVQTTARIRHLQGVTPVRRQTSLLRDLSSTKTICMVIFGFSLTWFPFLVFQLYYMHRGQGNCILSKVDTVVCWLTYFSAVLNPVIYAAREKNITQVIRKVCVLKRIDRDANRPYIQRLPQNIEPHPIATA